MELNDSSIFDGLNEPQKQAVASGDGPLLVVAGPGTGKTLTIVRRIAWLIRQGARPENILAVTFTNRAAREMKERIEALLGDSASNIFIGTFHLLGLRILRENCKDDFVIYTRDEQVSLLRELMNDSAVKARRAAEKISRIKNFLDDGDADIQNIHGAYQDALQQRRALDLDDLIRVPVELLRQREVARRYQERFRHIIVDEYQDINPAQCSLTKLLAGGANTICAVGDSDQAIYAFRGADLENFLNFERDFPGAKRITLSHNYRTSDLLARAADLVIRNNRKRLEKGLVTTRDTGARVISLSVPDERTEGVAVIQEIEQRMGGTSHYEQRRGNTARSGPERSFAFSDFGVIFRTNAQAKALEEAFSASGIPYQMIGRRRSEQAKEIEETVAYLQTLAQADGLGEPDRTDAGEAKLLTAADFFDPRAEAVALMTLHTAKGLEFRVVFITGCEDGLTPCTVMKDEADLEEERRLFYVGMTRAKDELFLIHARSRFLYGQRLASSSSPFIEEIPEGFKEDRVVADIIRKRKPEDKQMGLF